MTIQIPAEVATPKGLAFAAQLERKPDEHSYQWYMRVEELVKQHSAAYDAEAEKRGIHWTQVEPEQITDELYAPLTEMFGNYSGHSHREAAEKALVLDFRAAMNRSAKQFGTATQRESIAFIWREYDQLNHVALDECLKMALAWGAKQC